MRAQIQRPFFLFLLPLFFLFHGYVAYYPQVPFGDLFFPLLQLVAIFTAIWFMFRVYLKNSSNAAIVTFLAMAVYLFFGYIHDLLKSALPGSVLTSYKVVLSVLFLLLVVTIIILKKKNPSLLQLVKYLNILLVIFLIVDMVGLTGKIRREAQFRMAADKSPSCSTKLHPDIYFIVADEYAGSQHLKDLYRFDNNPFLDSLRQKGFFIANNSRSNYDFTPFSIASIMDMDYLPVKKEDVFSADPTIGFRKIFQNRLVALLKSWGYEFDNYSIFDFEGFFTSTANSLIPARKRLITSSTLFARLKKEAWLPLQNRLDSSKVSKDLKYENLNYNHKVFNALEKTVGEKKHPPRFVYAHLEMPHFPYYFDRNGRQYSYEELRKDYLHNDSTYVGYLQYANTELLELVDMILRKNETPPIIILMSDHGRRHFSAAVDPDYRFMNLFSIYIPGKRYEQFSDSISAVNVFRTLLNTSFCQQMPILEHRTIVANVAFDD